MKSLKSFSNVYFYERKKFNVPKTEFSEIERWFNFFLRSKKKKKKKHITKMKNFILFVEE